MEAATLERLRALLVFASAYTDNDQGGRDPHARERTRPRPNGWDSKQSGEIASREVRGLS